MKELYNNFLNEKRLIYQELPKGIQEAVQRAQEAEKATKKPKVKAAETVAETQTAMDKRNENEGKSYLAQIKRAIKDQTLVESIEEAGGKILDDKKNPERFKQYRGLMTEIYGNYFLAVTRARKKAKEEGLPTLKVSKDDFVPAIEKTLARYEHAPEKPSRKRVIVAGRDKPGTER